MVSLYSINPSPINKTNHIFIIFLFLCYDITRKYQLTVRQGSKIVLVRSYLRVPQAAGQVNILIFLVKIKFSPCMPINFVMQDKCLFSDISRPVRVLVSRSRGCGF